MANITSSLYDALSKLVVKSKKIISLKISDSGKTTETRATPKALSKMSHTSSLKMYY